MQTRSLSCEVVCREWWNSTDDSSSFQYYKYKMSFQHYTYKMSFQHYWHKTISANQRRNHSITWSVQMLQTEKEAKGSGWAKVLPYPDSVSHSPVLGISLKSSSFCSAPCWHCYRWGNQIRFISKTYYDKKAWWAILKKRLSHKQKASKMHGLKEKNNCSFNCSKLSISGWSSEPSKKSIWIQLL